MRKVEVNDRCGVTRGGQEKDLIGREGYQDSREQDHRRYTCIQRWRRENWGLGEKGFMSAGPWEIYTHVFYDAYCIKY